MQNAVELTNRLLAAIDDDCNILNMQEVLEVIQALEGMTISKEILETTRLGRYINEIRRKTRSRNLAERAINLVRRWRQVLGVNSAPQHMHN